MPWKRIRTGNFAPKFPEATQSDDVQNLVTDAMESIPYSVFSIGTDKNPFKRVGMPEYCRLVDAIQKKCEHHRQLPSHHETTSRKSRTSIDNRRPIRHPQLKPSTSIVLKRSYILTFVEEEMVPSSNRKSERCADTSLFPSVATTTSTTPSAVTKLRTTTATAKILTRFATRHSNINGGDDKLVTAFRSTAVTSLPVTIANTCTFGFVKFCFLVAAVDCCMPINFIISYPTIIILAHLCILIFF